MTERTRPPSTPARIAVTPTAMQSNAVTPTAPRANYTVRLHPAGLAAVDDRARRDRRNRSDMTRLLLAYAVQHMPEGWKPRA